MSQRIRYQRLPSTNEYLSVRLFHVKSKTYRVKLVGNKFVVLDMANESEVIVGEANNHFNLKILAKKALVNLGVDFEEETRSREQVELQATLE